MNHYKVYNGYTGYDAIYVDAYARNEEEALDQAVEKFKQQAKNPFYENQLRRNIEYGWDVSKLSEYLYESDYWNKDNFKIKLMYEGL